MKGIRLAGLMAMVLVAALGVAQAAAVHGTYLEARDAEVYASHCYANSELGLRGSLAVMAWQIDKGSVNDVVLDGLTVVAVVRAHNTLGDPFTSPYPAKAVLIVDERANADQRAALESFAKQAGGRLVETVVRTDVAPISMSFDGSIHERRATLTAGDLVTVKTRPIRGTDSLCHMDDVYYGPLVKLDHAMAAFSTQTSFHGEGLNVRFDDVNRSNAWMGTFALGSGAVTD
jgi:hypothetical protein